MAEVINLVAGDDDAIVLPYKPRVQFMPFHEGEWRFAAIAAHRRVGKTVACINHLIRAALACEKKDPRFAYVAPTFTQAKDVVWEYLKSYCAPLFEYGATSNESELRVDLPNGGRVRLYGAENYDRLRGIYLDGVVLDEYATMDPRIWEVVRPALSDRPGWCVWIGTPRGHNAFHEVWERSKTEAIGPDGWYSLMLKASQTGVLPESELVQARRDLTAEQYAQEYECSFEAAVMGAYYGREMEQAEADGRVGNVPHSDDVLVHTAWDLGIGDPTAIWFIQRVGKEWRFIDYLESSGVGLDWYVNQLQAKKYNYGQHVFPHDVAVSELTTGKSRKEVLERLGVNVTIAPKLKVEDGIQQVRTVLKQSWFDRAKCKRGVEALKLYRCDWDDKNKTFRANAVHDWTSHPADSMRYAALGVTGVNGAWAGRDYSEFSQGMAVV